MKEIDFSIKLTETRKVEKLTQEEVAEKCNLNVRTIQRIESGQVKPRAHTIRAISDVLEIDLSTPMEIEDRSFIWHIKDLFNFKTHKMRKFTVLSSSALLILVAIFFISGSIQAQSKNPAPKSGLTIAYNVNNSIQRIDAVYTNELTLDSLIEISEELIEHGVLVTYRSMAFDETGHLTSIECEMKIKDTENGGSFSVKDLDSINKEHHFGFYINNSKDAKDRSCTGACL